MIYNEQSLNCPNCKNRFESPRILPCMESICIKCINSLDSFECPFCFGVHNVPSEGFPVNKSLLKVLNAFGEDKILAKNEIQKYRYHLKNVQELLNYLDCDLDQAKSEITKYCESIKSQIVSTIDQQVNYLNDIRDELVDEVYLYEKDCIKTLEQESGELNFFKNVANDCQAVIQSEDFKKAESKEKIARVRKTEWKLGTHRKRYRNFLFKNVDLIYHELKIQQCPAILKRNCTQIDLDSFKQIDLSITLMNEFLDIKIKLNQLENRNFVLSYLNNCDLVFELRNLDQIEQVNKYFTDHLQTSKVDFLLKTFKNRIIYHKYSKFNKELTILNENLQIINSTEVKIHFKDIVATDTKIFCLKKKLDSITIYTWNLSKLMIIKQNSILYPFTSKIKNLFENEEYLFFEESDCVSMISKDGQLVEKISIQSYVEIICFENDCFYVYNKQANSIDVFDFNGLLIKSLNLKNFPNSEFKFILDKESNFSCFDLSSFRLYLQNF